MELRVLEWKSGFECRLRMYRCRWIRIHCGKRVSGRIRLKPALIRSPGARIVRFDVVYFRYGGAFASFAAERDTGALMRLGPAGYWMDSKSSGSLVDEFVHMLSPCAGLTPFPDYISPARLGLCNTYMTQAICMPTCDYQPGMKVRPVNTEAPILVPTHLYGQSIDKLKMIPGLNVYTVFMNMELTYEDGIVMSRSAAMRFEYDIAVIRVLTVPVSALPQKEDRIAPYSVPWWQSHFEGKIKSVERLDPNRVRVIINARCPISKFGVKYVSRRN